MADTKDTRAGAKSTEQPPKVGDVGYTPERNEQDPHDGRGEEDAAAAVAKAEKSDRR